MTAQPNSPSWLRGCAAVAQNLTQVSGHNGDFPNALAHITEAIETYRRWYELAPTNAQARAGFGTSDGMASQLCQEFRRWNEAEQAAREGARIFREGLHTDTCNARFAARLAEDLSFLRQVQITNGQHSAGVAALACPKNVRSATPTTAGSKCCFSAPWSRRAPRTSNLPTRRACWPTGNAPLNLKTAVENEAPPLR